jgi:N-sulfoglucosamine sulfohydrolase
VCNSLVSSIDIAPTLLDVAGVSRPETFQGQSFKGLLQNPEKKFRNYVFAEHNWHDFMAHERMVRTERFLYIENGLPQQDNRGAIDIMGGGAGQELQKGFEDGKLTDLQKRIFVKPQPEKELYDCINDTSQVHNLAGTGRFRKQQKQLENILAQWRKQTGDSHPDDLTGDWYDRITNKAIAGKGKRGTMPGADQNAHELNHPGPF